MPLRREAEPAATDQPGSVRPSRRKRSATRTETSPQRYSSYLYFQSNVPRKRLSAHDLYRRKSARRTAGAEVADPTYTGQAPAPGLEGEASARRRPDPSPTEDTDRLSATKSEVESAMNHRRRRTVFLKRASPLRHWTPLTQGTRISVPLKMVLPEPRSSM